MKMETVIDGLRFDSVFDGGNLCRVERRGKNDFNLFLDQESEQQMQCTWFYFSITSPYDKHISLYIKNLMNQTRLFNMGHRPVYKEKEWKRIPAHEWIGCSKSELGCVVRFRHRLLKGVTTYFAFCYPYSYDECQANLDYLEQQHASVLKRDLLCRSLLNRRVDLITVGVEPYDNKPHLIISARVHPGETPGQFMLFGLLNFLLSTHPSAKVLRETVVFKIVPMLNPDGVALGKYRTNSLGYNLNRFYCNPTSEHESILHLKNLASAVPNLVVFIDFHGHANKRGAFCYGNDLPLHRLREEHEFMQKIASHCSYFDPSICNFNPTNTGIRDKLSKDDETTEGAGRVQIYYANRHLTHSYTLEAHYACDHRYRPIGPVEWENVGASVGKAIHQMDFPNRMSLPEAPTPIPSSLKDMREALNEPSTIKKETEVTHRSASRVDVLPAPVRTGIRTNNITLPGINRSVNRGIKVEKAVEERHHREQLSRYVRSDNRVTGVHVETHDDDLSREKTTVGGTITVNGHSSSTPETVDSECEAFESVPTGTTLIEETREKLEDLSKTKEAIQDMMKSSSKISSMKLLDLGGCDDDDEKTEVTAEGIQEKISNLEAKARELVDLSKVMSRT